MTLLGLYGGGASAGISRISKAEKWLNRPVSVMGDSFPRDTWANVLNIGWATPAWKATTRYKAISVPLCTENDLPKYDLQGAATGAYDSKYSVLCDKLVGIPNLILRPGWEGNGGWYPWGMYDGTATRSSRAPLYVAAFQRFVKIARAKLPGVLISWNMACGNLGVPTQNLYPGDDFVDIISMDVYNVIWNSSYATLDDTTRFNFLRDQTNGLTWQANFAASHKKLLAWDEWGTGSKPSGQGYDTSKDAPGFIQKMWAWAIAHNFLYATYFNYPAPDGQWQVSPDWATIPGTTNTAKVFPNQQSQFLTTFGVPVVADILIDDDAAVDTAIAAFRTAQTNLINAQAAVTVAQTTVTSAQADVDAKRVTMLSAIDKLRTDAAVA